MRVVLILTGIIALVIGGLVYFHALSLDQMQRVWHPAAVVAPPPPAAVPVVVAAARTQDVPIYLSGIGTVQAYNTVNVQTQVDGQISQILFQEGQDVKAGDRLAIIDRRPYQAQLQQQVAARMRDQALLQGARLDLARYTELVKKDYATQQQVDQEQAQVGQYEGAVLNDTAQIAYAQTQLGFTTIASPIDGRVGIRQVDVGNFVRAAQGTTIVVVTQLRPISVIFTVSAEAVERSKLDLGVAHVPVIALAKDDTTELDRGSVAVVDNMVDQTTGTIKLKANFPNEKLKLWPGNFVNGRLVVDTRHDGVTVPSEAVRHGPRCDFTWIVRPDQTVATRCVTVGQTFADRTLIEKGLAQGAEVVVDGQYRLDEGSKVEITRRPPARSASAD
ncbi:efflux RND transporter periplasmic adaptor subunit [Acidisphaera sp. S103]|uniref:efflux RND transporter periplasmic adaptor subunit n=1 Tax=Acidisphaera sp. S103 TaxID=1747223 RepID=UPI00131DE9D1|nr:efflux RND transporter periplasmic adaptor subunit [Acidisphaera sp. S103]